MAFIMLPLRFVIKQHILTVIFVCSHLLIFRLLHLVGVYNQDSGDWSSFTDLINVERLTQSGD